MKKLILVALMCLLLSACGGGGSSGCDVTYLVEGSGSPLQTVLITVAGPNHTTSQATLSLPSKTEYKMNDGDFLYISGQNASSITPVFTVRILVDGVDKAHSLGSGYTIASAQGTCQ